MPNLDHTRGAPLPLGASRAETGVNFALLSRHATAVSLVLEADDGTPLGELPLTHRTGDHWHARVGGLPAAFRYGWRVAGPAGPANRFDPTRVLLDPTGKLVAGMAGWADPNRGESRSLFAPGDYDWGDDTPPRTALEDSIVYELHVRGFTRHDSADVQNAGTYRALIEKLPYLKWLGVTAIELLPVYEFDETVCPFVDPETGEKHLNFWGYNTVAFNAPKASFAANSRGGGPASEFRDLVKAAHAHGLEVWLDVVYNHTGEGDDRGEATSFRGIDNDLYYTLDEKGNYLNFSGCGNTVNCNRASVREFIVDSLRHWAVEMRVDGFRFDLASILARDKRGRPLAEPPVIEAISNDGVLAGTKLVAEPWDAGGLYQVGSFPRGKRWCEWNGLYRDDVRQFWRGDAGTFSRFASRLCGSPDLYAAAGRGPRSSLNFVTCHDGFTLRDLVSYDHKHNDRNGEGGRDGSDANLSWNTGVEGETTDATITTLRERRAKGMLATLLISRGVPMILGGDEFLRTQRGNNNAWCQDTELSWVDWRLRETNAGFLRFARELIWLRRRHPVFRRRDYPAARPGSRTGDAHPDIVWHGREPFLPNFAPDSKVLAWSLHGNAPGAGGDADFYFAISTDPTVVTVTVPPAPSGRGWRRLFDTAAPSPRDFAPEGEGEPVAAGAKLKLERFAMVALDRGRDLELTDKLPASGEAPSHPSPGPSPKRRGGARPERSPGVRNPRASLRSVSLRLRPPLPVTAGRVGRGHF